MACIKSGTVKRLIYTGTVLASSPTKDDGNGFKDLMDETCWTPLNVHFPFSDDFVMVRFSFLVVVMVSGSVRLPTQVSCNSVHPKKRRVFLYDELPKQEFSNSIKIYQKHHIFLFLMV